jgi:hypothetical protein
MTTGRPRRSVVVSKGLDRVRLPSAAPRRPSRKGLIGMEQRDPRPPFLADAWGMFGV